MSGAGWCEGHKHPLGLVEGATENAAVVQALIDNLIERGLDPKACRPTKSMVGVSPSKGRLMDEILDAEYKVVEHQIAPPLDPSPRWRFQQLPLQNGPHE